MNAPLKSAAMLDELYAERKDILAKIEETKATRAKLNDLDAEVEVAKTAMDDFANKFASVLDQWSAGNCVGARPAANYEQHKTLERKFLEARHSATLAACAKNSLAIREKEIGEQLHEIGQAIKNAIADKFAGEYTASGTRADKLRDELAELDAKLLAGRAFWVNFSEEFRAANGKRNPAYDLAAAQAEASLPETDAHSVKNFAMPEFDQLKKIEDQFLALFKGE
jgi:uncharacterized coiled-coil DUF342 family protein